VLIALASLGSFTGDQIYFLIGRRYGKRLMARFPRFTPAIRRVDALVVRYAGVAVIAVRFLYGLRTVGPMAIGASCMPWRKFVLFNAAGAIAWGSMLIGDLRRVELWLFAGVAAAALALGAYFHFHRRATVRLRQK
jgi:membrane protein DedA with SNARE-associated domain